MPHLEFTLTCGEADQPRVEAALDAAGALSVTLLDADAETPNERAVLEPGVGEMPLWSGLVVCALFEADVDRNAVLLALAAELGDLDLGSARFREVADQDWERAWMDRFQPMAFGRRLWIYPWNIEPPADDSITVVRLDPGLAFGTGTHPTTALCLQWLDELDLCGARVLDFGCGSGVLAIAALKLGAASALAVDNDPQAVLATRDNALRNDVQDRLHACLPEDEAVDCHDVVVANILASALDSLAELLAERCREGGRIALSGILAGQEDELLHRYARWFDDLRVKQQDDWIRITGIRRSVDAA